uniref:Uracil-DNA glycosylase-like domain-containing protein n=1 Tax=Globisporangium ultimum (strain ATCC 200006 / CBS 805.95 / DAOM BR144) TaxID=431595 RepID=K3X2B6_GLOUD
MFARFRFQSKRRTRDENDLPDAASLSSIAATAPEQSMNEPEAASPVTSAAKKPKRQAATASEVVVPPYSKWQERWHGICDECFRNAVKCTHYPEQMLRLLIVGHNPSDHAWTSEYKYHLAQLRCDNPSNRMWSLIVGNLHGLSWQGILPPDSPVAIQNAMPYLVGVGFTSIGLEPGNDAAKYGKQTMQRWKNDFFRRLREHTRRVCATSSQQQLLKSERSVKTESCQCSTHGPMLIAFSGKRQFSFLFSPPLKKIEHYGKQTRLPDDWPHECVAQSEVWVLPSSSGRSALTHEQRSAPYRQLAQRFHDLPWPPQNETSNAENVKQE